MTGQRIAGAQVGVDYLSMRRATNLLDEAGDELGGNPRRVLDSRDAYRHQVSPELATAMDSFADRWTLALSSLAEVIAGAGDTLAATQGAYQAADDEVWAALHNLGGRL